MITRPRITHKKKQNSTVKQLVHEVHEEYITVMTKSGRTYNTTLDTNLKLKVITPKDTAVIDTNTWKVIDIIKHRPRKEKKLSQEEEELEIQRQKEELMNMGYDY